MGIPHNLIFFCSLILDYGCGNLHSSLKIFQVDENPKQQQRRYSGLKTAIHKSSGTTYVQKDSLASGSS